MTDIIKSISHVLHVVVNCTGIFLNSLLMLLIIFKTPKTLRSYAVLLFNFAITDFLGCCSALFVMQRIIPSGWSLFYISYGYCTNIGEMACYPAPEPIVCVIVCIIVYIPSAFQAITFMTASDDIGAVRQHLQETFPEYNLTGAVVTGHLDIQNFWTIYTILYMTLPSGPIYLIVLFFRRKVYSCLNLADMSEATKRTHKLLMKALSIQACLPALFVLVVACYTTEQLNLLHHPILELAVFQLLGLLPMISPILSLHFVRPYRIFITNCFYQLANWKAVVSVSTINSIAIERGPSHKTKSTK